MPNADAAMISAVHFLIFVRTNSKTLQEILLPGNFAIEKQ